MKYYLSLCVLALFLLNSCSTLLSSGLVKTPEISVNYLKPGGGASDKGIPSNFALGLALHNPNAFAIPIENFGYQFFLGDMLLLEGQTTMLPTFAANSTTNFEVSSTVGVIDAFKVAKFFLLNSSGGFNYSLVTDIKPSGFTQQNFKKTYVGDIANPFASR